MEHSHQIEFCCLELQVNPILSNTSRSQFSTTFEQWWLKNIFHIWTKRISLSEQQFLQQSGIHKTDWWLHQYEAGERERVPLHWWIMSEKGGNVRIYVIRHFFLRFLDRFEMVSLPTFCLFSKNVNVDDNDHHHHYHSHHHDDRLNITEQTLWNGELLTTGEDQGNLISTRWDDDDDGDDYVGDDSDDDDDDDVYHTIIQKILNDKRCHGIGTGPTHSPYKYPGLNRISIIIILIIFSSSLKNGAQLS